MPLGIAPTCLALCDWARITGDSDVMATTTPVDAGQKPASGKLENSVRLADFRRK